MGGRLQSLAQTCFLLAITLASGCASFRWCEFASMPGPPVPTPAASAPAKPASDAPAAAPNTATAPSAPANPAPKASAPVPQPSGPVLAPPPAPPSPLSHTSLPAALPGTLVAVSTVPPDTPFERVATLTQDLGTLDDDRKALAGRVQYLEAQLAEKELALTSGLRELEGARGDLARSQEDLVRWRREMSTLRERLRNLEKENRDTMEAMIKVLERVVSKESKPGPGEGAPPPR